MRAASGRARRATRGAALLASGLGASLAAALAAGCSGALYSEYAFRAGQPAPHGSLSRAFAARLPGAGTPASRLRDGAGAGAGAEAGAGASASPVLKADVLAALGPPGEVLPLVDGDVFVYRLRLTDVEFLNLNTGIFTGVFVPVYARLEGRQRDDALFVQFDAAGRLTAVSEAGP
jgi:hypothetical protein